MINKITIQNYKSIIDLELQLGKLNIFIGENGCGKTNILEAISCCSIVADTESNGLTDTLMSLRGIRITEPFMMKSAFKTVSNDDVTKDMLSLNPNLISNISVSNEIDEGFGIKIHNYQQNGWTAVPYLDNLQKNTQNHVNQIRKKNNGIPPSKYRPYLEKMFGKNSISSFYNYAPENYFLRRFEEEGQIKPLGIRGEGLFKHLMDIYKKKPELLKKIGEKIATYRLVRWFRYS